MSKELFNKGNQLYNSALYEDALKMYKAVVAEDITYYDAHFCVAKTLLRLKNTTEGLAHFKKYAGLIPTEKLQDYLLGFVNILQQENFNKEAISLLKSFKVPFGDKLNKKYLELLLIFEDKNNFYSHILKSVPLAQQNTILKEIVALETIPNSLKQEIMLDNIVEKNTLNSKRIQALAKNTYSNQLLFDDLKQIKAKHASISSGKTEGFKQVLDEIDKDYANALGNVYEVHKKFGNDIRILQKIKSFLENNKFDKSKIVIIEDKIKQYNKIQKSKNLKRFGLFASLVLLAVIGYFTYDYFSTKSSQLEFALSHNEISLLDEYLEQYGDNADVNKKREFLMYNNALKNNSSELINAFTEAYPESKYLRTIKVINDANKTIQVFGSQSFNSYLNPKNKNEYIVPYGCIIGLKGAMNKVNVDKKYIQICKNVTIYNNDFLKNDTLELEKLYYINATALNLREYEYSTSKVLYQVPRGEPIAFLGKTSQYKSKANFYGEEINDYYYYVQTINNQTGWVHGAGINNLEVNYNLSLSDFKLNYDQIKTFYNDSTGLIKPKSASKIDTIIEANIVEDTIIHLEQTNDSKAETNELKETERIKDVIKKEKPTPQKVSCTNCNGKGIISKKCTTDGCQNGFISATCTTCNGNYRSGKGICPNPGCNYVGCEYCDYDGAACTKCSRGKTTIKHNLCNGTGRISSECTSCNVKGYTIN